MLEATGVHAGYAAASGESGMNNICTDRESGRVPAA